MLNQYNIGFKELISTSPFASVKTGFAMEQESILHFRFVSYIKTFAFDIGLPVVYSSQKGTRKIGFNNLKIIC